MNSYLEAFKDHLTEQNMKSISYMRNDLSAFYGRENFIDHLANLGSDAVRRSAVTGAGEENQILGLAQVGRVSAYQNRSIMTIILPVFSKHGTF